VDRKIRPPFSVFDGRPMNGNTQRGGDTRVGLVCMERRLREAILLINLTFFKTYGLALLN